tara:strand:+ start:439 stop:591 length:153 start_codon:yes stop_codon:yes gene_type:complete
MNKAQCSDYANMKNAGNNKGGTISSGKIHVAGKTNGGTVIPPKGTSNGGK